MSKELTHIIPVFAASTNAAEFLEAKIKSVNGREMQNEINLVIPQFIMEHVVRDQENKLQILQPGMQPGVPKMSIVPSTVVYFYSYYGECKCTEDEFKEWEQKVKIKKD